MAFFKWYGLTAEQSIRSGVSCASSLVLLQELLAEQNITLVTAREKTKFHQRLSFQETATFFYELHTLLAAHIRLHQAVTLLAQQTTQSSFKAVLQDIVRLLERGYSLAQACSMHETYFSPFACQLLAVGYETNSLAALCLQLARYYELLDQFLRRTRSLLLGPLITLLVFSCTMLGLFLFVVPRLELLLQHIKTPLPAVTRAILAVSHVIQNPVWFAVIVGTVLVGILFVVWKWYTTRQPLLFTYGSSLPYVKQWLADQAAAQFLRTLSMLLEGGVSLLTALPLATAAVANATLRERYEYAAARIMVGEKLTVALEDKSLLLRPTVLALINVGESTGSLATLLVRSSTYYNELLIKKLTTVGTLVQPVVLVILGIGVTIIIIALYQPIMSLSVSLS